MFKGMKRGVSLILAMCMMFTLFTFSVGASTYPDKDYWATEALDAAVKNKILYGRENGDLDPEANLTRAEMAAIVVRSFGATIKGNINEFVDVSPSSWYYDYISKAVHMGAFIGNGNGYMYPDNFITREEIITVLARLVVLSSDDFSPLNKYPDKDEISDWAKPYASALVARKYVNGNEKGMITPKANVTRAEFAQMMHNIFKNYYSKEGTYNTVVNGGVMVNESGVELSDMTINGDLVIGDGVGYGTFKLNNVTVNGRILFRGGEKLVTLTKTTVSDSVVIYDINGVVNFNNYRTDKPFKNLLELTMAKFKTRAGGGSGTTQTPEYYIVTFHDSADPDTNIGTAQINKAYEEANRTLKYIQKDLDTIYGNPGKALETYERSELPYANGALAATDYTHSVSKEYIYFDDTTGVWVPFTEETIVSKDIDVYLAGKHAILSADLMGLPYAPDVAYDSQSRAVESFIDLMILTGGSLANADSVIEPRINDMYSKLNSTTGMVDLSGNILDKDYGMKIIDVISYNKIQAEVKAYIDSIIVGVQGETEAQYKERLASFINMIEIPYLVTNIGGKTLIEFIPEATLREMLLDGAVKAKVIPYIQSALKDKTKASDLVDGILGNPDATNSLIENLLADSGFIAQMIEMNPVVGKDSLTNEDITLQDKILQMIKEDQVKVNLLACIENQSIANEILKLIKEDEDFKNAIISLTTDTQDEINAKIALRKSVISMVAEAGKSPFADEAGTDLAMTENGKKVKDIVISKIKNSNLDADFKNALDYDYVYESVLETYVTDTRSQYFGKISGIRLSATKVSQYAAMIDEIVAEVIAEYFNGQMSDELSGIINNAVMEFAKDYINNENIDESLLPIIEKNIIAFIKGYFKGTIVITEEGKEKIAALEASIKTNLSTTIKGISDKSVFKNPIVTFVTDVNNSDAVNSFVVSNYETMTGIVTKDFILSFIEGLSDDEVNDLVIANATPSIIVDFIVSLPTEPVNKRQELANKIRAFLETYKPYKDFMKAFELKHDTFVVNKDNIYFVTAVGEAIYGFDFDEILVILNEQGFGPLLNLVDRAELEQIFVDAKNDYWNGLQPIIEDVKAKTNPSNPNFVGEDYCSNYTTKLNVTINAPAILRGMYNNKANVFKDKILNNGIYDYENNTALKSLVNIDWFNLLIGYDANRKDEATGITGYYVRDYMEYYAAMLDIAVLFDDALCFYNTTDYDDEEMKEVKKSLTKDFITFIENMEKLSDNIASGEAIYKGATLNDLIAKVDSLKGKLDSFGGTIPAEYTSVIKDVVDRMKFVLTELGEGNLPAGYTVADMEILSAKLRTVIESMNENDYENANKEFKSVITSVLSIVDRVFAKLDNGGLESLISNVNALNSIYKSFKAEIESLISTLAGFEFGSLEIPFDAEKFEDIIFGRETKNIFNIDNVFEMAKGKLGESSATGFDKNRGVYIVDSYSKTVKVQNKDNTIILERTFY